MTRFEPYKGAKFTESDVADYLETLLNTGWRVFKDDRPMSYVIEIDHEKKIIIRFKSSRKEWQVIPYELGRGKSIEGATTFPIFKKLIVDAANCLGHKIDESPTTIRLVEKEPVTNRYSLVSLANGSIVKSIFDPYFEDKSIHTLVVLRNLGLKLDSSINVLTTSKSTSRLSKIIIEGFFIQTGNRLAIRHWSQVKLVS